MKEVVEQEEGCVKPSMVRSIDYNFENLLERSEK